MNLPLNAILQDPESFENLMQEIDTQLKNEDVSIQGRSIAGLTAITKKFKCSLSWESNEAKAINNWFVQTYGDKLKLNWDIGKTVVQIKGDIYSVKLPRIFGQVRVNIIEWIEKCTPKLLQSLSETELDAIAAQIYSHFEAYSKMEKMPRENTTDLDTSVNHLTNQHPQYGLSRWASLQASEKTLKDYIKKQGGTFPKGGKNGHNLSKLLSIAEQNGLPALDQALISSVQCSAGVRYSETLSSKEEAIEAYLASVQICAHVAEHY